MRRVEFIGRGGEHQKLLFNQNGTSIYGLLFRDRREFRIGEVVDITFTLHENSFNGRSRIEIILDEINSQ